MNPLTPAQKTALIAESMGWKRREGAFQWQPPSSYTSTSGTSGQPHKHLPRYLDDANAAETLCEALAKEGWHCDLNNGLDRTWECEFSRPPTVETNPDDIGTRGDERLEIHYGAATTLAAAIAEAYGKCRGLWT